MATVRVSLMGDLAALLGTRRLDAEVAQGATVAELLDGLAERYGDAFAKRVFLAPGKLHHTILVFVDGEDINEREGLATPLGESEVEVFMLPMLGGGESWR